MRSRHEGGGRSHVQITALGARTYVRLKLVGLIPLLPQERGPSIGTTELPTKVGTVIPGLARILCLSAGEWFLTSAARSVENLTDHIAGDRPAGLAIIDLSDGLSALEIHGIAARELLSKGSGVDFHARAFPVGHCARTRFAQIPVIIECLVPANAETQNEECFELHVARSYLDYLHSWLLDAAMEFDTNP